MSTVPLVDQLHQWARWRRATGNCPGLPSLWVRLDPAQEPFPPTALKALCRAMAALRADDDPMIATAVLTVQVHHLYPTLPLATRCAALRYQPPTYHLYHQWGRRLLAAYLAGRAMTREPA